LTTAFTLAVAIVLIAREQVATHHALERVRDEHGNATRYAAGAQRQGERAGHRFTIVLHSLQSLLLRLGDETLPNVPQVKELRRSIAEHAQTTIEGFVDASSSDPEGMSESATAYIHLANLYFMSGRIEKCRASFSHAIHLYDQLVATPSDSAYRAQLGQCHHMFGLQLYASGFRTEAIDQFDQARRAYLRAVELNPESSDSRRRLRWFLAISPERQFRDPDQVLELTAKMIQQEKLLGLDRTWDPTRSPHWLLSGMAFYRKGVFTSAIDTLERPLQNQLHETESLYAAGDLAIGSFLLATAFQQIGERSRALDSYRTAARIMQTSRPRDAEVMIFQAEAAALLGVPERPKATENKEEDIPQRSKP
jgi:tetratricopeptide (TPR) repeat protein